MNTFKQFLSVVILPLSLQASVAIAADSGEQKLNGPVGATDYFKVTCAAGVAGDTDHLSFKLIDNSMGNSGTPLLYEQVINAKLTKDGVEQLLKVTAGESQQVTLSRGNGKYQITLDTLGTDLAKNAKNKFIIPSQKYKLQYRCLNSDGIETAKPFNVLKSINTNNKASLALTCKANKNLPEPDTQQIIVTLSNVTAKVLNASFSRLPVLNAQVTRMRNSTLNTTDFGGDELYSPEIKLSPKLQGQSGNGEYLISVNHTGVVENQDTVKRYSFQYRCANSNDEETSTGELSLLQDQ
jgi:hypothetical protein